MSQLNQAKVFLDGMSQPRVHAYNTLFRPKNEVELLGVYLWGQAEMRICAVELSVMVGPSMEPTAFDVEEDQDEYVVRERMAG